MIASDRNSASIFDEFYMPAIYTVCLKQGQIVGLFSYQIYQKLIGSDEDPVLFEEYQMCIPLTLVSILSVFEQSIHQHVKMVGHYYSCPCRTGYFIQDMAYGKPCF